MKRILPVFLLILFIALPIPVFAAYGGFYYNHPNIRTKNVTGVIKEIRRNTIIIYDETDEILRTLVNLTYRDEVRVGDHVSIRYLVRDNVIESIKKVRFVEYKKDGQNLGYFFKK